MITVRPAAERGQAHHGWLESQHTFSFASYHDPAHMGFGNLRVINEDHVVAGAGFPTHPHRDMEIISYVIAGALEHRDSMGNGSVIRPGDVQRMSAGTGVTHSEFNQSKVAPLHFLQIWIQPDELGLEPGYEQRAFAEEKRRGRLCLLASREGEGGSLRIHQDIRVYAALLDAGESVSHAVEGERHQWLQIVSGAVAVNGTTLSTGDGAALSDESILEIRAIRASHFLLFDLAQGEHAHLGSQST